MKKILKAISVVAALLPIAMGTAMAQVTEDGMGKVIPVELFACSFNGRQDQDDLDAVIARWNRWMDERNNDDYAAWTLTPYHYSPTQDFDVNEGFEEVLTCGAHIGLGSAMYKAPPGNETPGTAIITMMDCELNEGNRYTDVKAAELAWAKHMTDTGSNAGTFHWFPYYGGGDAEYDYKVVNAYANYTELGADWERFSNGGGREISIETFGDVDECDDARVYIATSRRAAQLR
jgi:hypothetical protein